MSSALIRVPAYENLVRPTANLKRSVWSYFGIPANKAGHILTRSCAICIQCQRPFLYKSPHDDNLRAHLQLEHPDKFGELTAEKATRPNGTRLAKTLRSTDLKAKSSPVGDDESTLVYEQQLFLDAENIEEEVVEYILEEEEDVELEFLMQEAETVVEVTVPEADAEPADKVAMKRRKSADTECPSAAKRTKTGQTKTAPAAIRPPTVAGPQLRRLVAEMCADDLMQPHQFAGRGFARFVSQMTGGATTELPDAASVADELNAMHSALLERSRVAVGEPFALAIERWVNAQGSPHFTLSTLLSAGAQSRRNLCTWSAESRQHSSKTEPWASALATLDLAQCEAIVVNFCATAADIAAQLPDCLFRSNATPLPVVRCIRAIIESEVRAAIVALPAYGRCRELPPECPEPMRALLVLAEWCERNSSEEAAKLAGPVLECLQPLKIALDTLRQEPETSASLCRPLAQQLVANHFGEADAGEEAEPQSDAVAGTLRTIRESVRTALEEHILSNQFLATCSYLDPRFHTLTDDEDALLPGIRQQIRAKSPKPTAPIAPPTEATAPIIAKTTAPAAAPAQKAGGLSFFFAAAAKKAAKPRAPPAPPIDAELQRYATSVEALPFDQSPRQWWRSSPEAGRLPLLAAIAERCWCVPAMLPPPEEAESAAGRRWLRSDATLSAVLALHEQRMAEGKGSGAQGNDDIAESA